MRNWPKALTGLKDNPTKKKSYVFRFFFLVWGFVLLVGWFRWLVGFVGWFGMSFVLVFVFLFVGVFLASTSPV